MSRDPKLMTKMLQQCFLELKQGYETIFPDRELRLTHTLRTLEQQAELYKKGRRGVVGEQILTKCDGLIKRSKHQDGRAFDVAVFMKGKPAARWDGIYYIKLGPILDDTEFANKVKWGGRFTGKLKEDWYHFEERYD